MTTATRVAAGGALATYRSLLRARTEPQMVEVPAVQALVIDGRGRPESTPVFQEAIGALYGLTYTTKFSLKGVSTEAYPVMPVEGLWTIPGGLSAATAAPTGWRWTLLIVQPAHVTPAMIEDSREHLRRRGRGSAALERVRLAPFDEGRAAQLMHIGPYDAEGPSIARLHAFIRENGCRPRGRHHEIYIGDPRRSDPSRLKTLLRQPVEAMPSRRAAAR